MPALRPGRAETDPAAGTPARAQCRPGSASSRDGRGPGAGPVVGPPGDAEVAGRSVADEAQVLDRQSGRPGRGYAGLRRGPPAARRVRRSRWSGSPERWTIAKTTIVAANRIETSQAIRLRTMRIMRAQNRKRRFPGTANGDDLPDQWPPARRARKTRGHAAIGQIEGIRKMHHATPHRIAAKVATPSPIRTVPSAPEFHRIMLVASPRARGLYRRSGLDRHSSRSHPNPEGCAF